MILAKEIAIYLDGRDSSVQGLSPLLCQHVIKHEVRRWIGIGIRRYCRHMRTLALTSLPWVSVPMSSSHSSLSIEWLLVDFEWCSHIRTLISLNPSHPLHLRLNGTLNPNSFPRNNILTQMPALKNLSILYDHYAQVSLTPKPCSILSWNAGPNWNS